MPKSGVLKHHWLVDPDAGLLTGVDTPDSLAISTSPDFETASRFGNFIIEISLPKERLVERWNEPGMTDLSVLYYIEPSAIKGIFPSRSY